VAYTPLSTVGFKGLRLDADPQDLGLSGAVSVQNVEFEDNGTVRTRAGYDQMAAGVPTGTPLGLFYVPARQDVWLTTTTVETGWDGDGAAYTAATARLGFTESALIIDNSIILANTTGEELRLGSAVGAPTTNLSADSPAGKFVSFTGFPGGRLGVAYADLGTPVSNRVIFSEPGDVTNFGADDFVDLGLAGEEITGAVDWRDMWFVFKERVFYIFYGTSTDATGGAIFNYREVAAKRGATEYAVCAALDGVYFVGVDGVYRTTGGEPQLVSEPLRPFFEARTSPYFAETGPLSSPRIHASDDRLYVWQKGSAEMFVMDLQSREWSFWSLGTAVYALCPTPTNRELFFVDSAGQLYKISPDYTDDNGASIAAHYQTGFVTVADGSKTRIRGFHLTGEGTVSHSTAVDLGAAGTTASVTLGSPGYDMRSAQGRDVSMRLSSTSGEWSVSKWSALVAGARGVR
jgi:hypothetical protein